MMRRIDTKYIALVMFFTFCQVIGVMCLLPDLSVAKETAIFIEVDMACPMDGTIMCPPSITSSLERQLKPTMVLDCDHVTTLLSHDVVPTFPITVPQWPWSTAYSIVPISIDSSSVLRI